MVIALLGTVSLASCGDDEHYDFPGDPYNKVYMANRDASFEVVSTPVSTTFSLDYEVWLKCTRRAAAEIHATVAVDNSLVDAYNDAHGTSFAPLPEGILVFDKEYVTIKPDTLAAAEPLRITVTEDAAALSQLSDKNGYLIPLCIVSSEGADARPSIDRSTVYLTVSVSLELINPEATEDEIRGTLVTDQSGWSATTTGQLYEWYGPIESLFDGDPSSTVYIMGDNEIDLDVDMGREYSFDAITCYYTSTSWGGDLIVSGSMSDGTKIAVSSDGATWNAIGTIETGASAYCVFYEPITARYIRLTVPAGGWSTTLEAGIFNVYAIN